MSCIFCDIADKKAEADIIYEDEKVIAFENIRPLAPVHVLVIPKRHIETVDDITEEDIEFIGHLWNKIKEVAEKKELTGYKVAVNVKEEGGQEVFHLHYHLLGGWKSKDERDVPGMP